MRSRCRIPRALEEARGRSGNHRGQLVFIWRLKASWFAIIGLFSLHPLHRAHSLLRVERSKVESVVEVVQSLHKIIIESAHPGCASTQVPAAGRAAQARRPFPNLVGLFREGQAVFIPVKGCTGRVGGRSFAWYMHMCMHMSCKHNCITPYADE